MPQVYRLTVEVPLYDALCSMIHPSEILLRCINAEYLYFVASCSVFVSCIFFKLMKRYRTRAMELFTSEPSYLK